MEETRASRPSTPPNGPPRMVVINTGPEKTSPFHIISYIIVIAASMAFIIYYAKNLEQYLEDLRQLGFWGNIFTTSLPQSSSFATTFIIDLIAYQIFILSYLPAGLPFAVLSYYIPLSLSAGFLYKIVLGVITSMLGSVSASMFGFWVTRAFCRSWIEEKIKASARLSTLLLAMEYHSFKVTLMVRFLPIPFGLQNGLCAMTSITYEKFLISSTIGLLPENILLIYFGSTFSSFNEGISDKRGNLSFTTYEKVMLGLAVLGTCVIFFLARKMLDATIAMARAGNKKREDVEMGGLLLGNGQGSGPANGNGKDGEQEIEVENSRKSFGGKENLNGKDKDVSQPHHSSNFTTPVKINKSASI